VRESLIESDGVKYAEDRGWAVYKWTSPGRAGILDRLHFKNGFTFAIEYKATSEKASVMQQQEAMRLSAAGIPCRCCDSPGDARAFIDTMTAAADRDDCFIAQVLALDISTFYW
jgi:hypothetical protein